MKLVRQRYFSVLVSVVLCIAHAFSCMLIKPDGFVMAGRTGLLITGIILLLSVKHKDYFKKISLLSLGAFLSSLLIFSLPIGIGYWMGMVTFTFGDNGLSETFKKMLPWYGLFFLSASILGTEVIFRGTYSDVINEGSAVKRISGILLQAGFYILFLLPALYPYLFASLSQSGSLFLMREFLAAIAAGFLFGISGHLIISGLWTFTTGFINYYLLNDVESGIESAFYYVTSSTVFNYLLIGFQIVLVLGLSIIFFCKMKDIQTSPAQSQ